MSRQFDVTFCSTVFALICAVFVVFCDIAASLSGYSLQRAVQRKSRLYFKLN